MADIVRLVPEDFDELSAAPEPKSSLKRIRDHHHLIARLVAEGRRSTDIAAEVGLSISRVSILKSDPAFQQLVEMYRANINQLRDAAFASTEAKMAFFYNEGWDYWIDRLLEDPDNIPPDTFFKILDHIGDRIGYAKTTKSVNLNMAAKAESLAEIVAARRKRADEKLLEPPPTGEK